MRAIVVSVDFADLLAVTLACNRHHFSEVGVVTHPRDKATVTVARDNGARVFLTHSFYAGGAEFNKWRAMEEGLDWIGREGWLVLLDADVLWPKVLPAFDMEVGTLYTPKRRLHTNVSRPIPPEDQWGDLPLYVPDCPIFGGYSQIFHADDPHLPAPPPWHGLDWRHAGRGDTLFQSRWPADCKRRPPFEVLHLGEPGVNWYGRVTGYLDGSQPPDAAARRVALRKIVRSRQHTVGGR